MKCFLPYQRTRMSQPPPLQTRIPEPRGRPGETIPAIRQPSATPPLSIQQLGRVGGGVGRGVKGRGLGWETGR